MENHVKISVQMEFIFRSTREFLHSKYLATVPFISKTQTFIKLKLIYVTRIHAFVILNCFPKKFFSIYGYCNLQNFSLTFKTYSKTYFISIYGIATCKILF